jgi:hypothetical protein
MVVKQVKQWLTSRANAARWRPIQDWADARGAEFRQARDGAGFVVDAPKALPGALHIEWGASQRSYLPGVELRMRCEMRLHPELQLMVLCRALMERLESTVFEAYTDTLQTRVDTDTPEEMRWLVMFSKASPASPALRQRCGVLGVTKELAGAWLEGGLGAALVQAGNEALPAGHPFVLMAMRGNVYLRTALPDADLPRLPALVQLLEIAAREAQRLNGRLSEAGPWESTSAAAWQVSAAPDRG